MNLPISVFADRAATPRALASANHPRRRGLAALLIGLLDAAAIVLSMLLMGQLGIATVPTVVLTVGFFAAAGLYRLGPNVSGLDDAPLCTILLAVAGLVGAWLAQFGPGSSASSAFRLSTAVTIVVGVVIGRIFSTGLVRRLRRRGVLVDPTIVVGNDDTARALASLLTQPSRYGLVAVGLWNPDGAPSHGLDVASLPSQHIVLGEQGSLGELVMSSGASAVAISSRSLDAARLVSEIRSCDRLPCEVYVTSASGQLPPRARPDAVLDGIPLSRLPRRTHRTLAWRVKRLFDIVVGLVGLALAAPVLAVSAVLLRFEVGRSILFRQHRIGQDGRVIEVLKLRTVPADVGSDPDTAWNVSADPGIGPIGRFLRATSLDELPQLWNVVRGDMSLVGPRPERPHFVGVFSDEIPDYVARHRVPVGLTGLAQVHGLRGDTSITDRVRLDNLYIDTWSLVADVNIILRTIAHVVRRRPIEWM